MRLDPYEKELVQIAQEIVYYLRKAGASPENSHDVTQDVLVKMLESELILPREKIRAWMYRTAVRRYIDLYRRDSKYLEIVQQEFFKKEQTIAFEQPDYEPLYEAVNGLKDQYRLVLDLFYFQGMSIKEISHILHISLSKVKIDLMRGRKQVQATLTKEGYTYEDFK